MVSNWPNGFLTYTFVSINCIKLIRGQRLRLLVVLFSVDDDDDDDAVDAFADVDDAYSIESLPFTTISVEHCTGCQKIPFKL